MNLRITTFNVENLFNRYAFLDLPWENRSYEKIVQAVGLVSVASRNGDLVPEATTVIQRNNTALAIELADPDILVVQEVENLYTLRIFNDEYLGGRFDRMLSIDGNDPRGIDVGVLIKKGVKADILGLRTHIDDVIKGGTVARTSVPNFGYMAEGALFSRDCLEVDLKVGNVMLTVLANHFKSQDKGPSHIKRRREQAERVAELATAAAKAGKKPIVIGDLNSDFVRTHDGSLDALLAGHPHLVDPVSNPEEWTHFYEAGHGELSRLDYILVDKTLTYDEVPPQIVRNGLSTKCKKYAGQRFPTVGPKHTEASDHCPLTVTLKI